MWSKCGHFIFQAHLGLISVSFGAQENVVKMWSFEKKCCNFIFQAHLGLISVSFGAQENVVKMWSFEISIKMWSKCGHNVVKMWSFS